jgi:hypothetical protein
MAQITYADVVPIFRSKCTGCHNKNSHAISLLSYSEINSQKTTISSYLNSGYMPPWTPDTLYTRFVHERTITLHEKNTILTWIANGAQKGDTTLIAAPPTYSKNKLNATPDLELTIPLYTSNASITDNRICFSLPSGLTQDRIIKAFEIVPGNAAIVHHVIATVDTTGTISSNLSGNCGLIGDFGIGAFAPGTAPCVFPSSSKFTAGIRIKSGSNIILQIHYPKGTAGQVDSTKIRIYFYPAGTLNIRKISTSTFTQPNAFMIPANTLKTITTQTVMTRSVSVLAAFPHSHHLATQIINYAYHLTDTIPLIRINKWEFDFQGYYTFRNMPKISSGYTMLSKHVFDNTSNNPDNPNSPPVSVSSGNSTSNEMIVDAFQWLDYKNGDEFINVDSILANDPLINSIKQNKNEADLKVNIFPNPFESNTTIEYELNYPSKVSIEIFTFLGVRVRSLKNKYEGIGVNDVVWDGKNNEGTGLPNGIYFYLITAGNNQAYGKLTLLK